MRGVMDCDPAMGSLLSDWLGVDIDISDAGNILLTSGQEGLKSEISTRVVTDPTVQQMAQTNLEKGAAQKVADFIIQNKTLIGVALGSIILLTLVTTFRGRS